MATITGLKASRILAMEATLSAANNLLDERVDALETAVETSGVNIEPYVGEVYSEGDLVVHRGAIWKADRDTLDTDVPGVTPAATNVGGNHTNTSNSTDYDPTQWRWQEFTMAETVTVTALEIKMSPADGNISNESVVISPGGGGATLAGGTFPATTGHVWQGSSWARVTFSAPVALQEGTTYRIQHASYHILPSGVAVPSGVVSAIGANNYSGAARSLAFRLIGAASSPWRRLAGTLIQDEGVDRTSRAKLSFVGDGVTVTDDAPNDRTTVTIPGTKAPTYTVATIPAAASGNAGQIIFVWDAAAGEKAKMSTGSAWINLG